jgi:sugar/nucleoside kinase (ribokinase family)
MVADVVTRPVRELPERGRLVLAERMELHTGGCAVNTAIALAKLGLSAGVIGKVGQDGFGDFILSKLRRYGLEVSGVKQTPEANTSATMVLVEPDGERRFIHYLGANADLVEEDVDWRLIEESRILHIAGSLVMPGIDGRPTADILRRARQGGVITALDTVWDAAGRWLELIEPCLPHIDYFLPSLEEARMIASCHAPSEIAQFFLDHGVGVVALKMGEEGCYLRSPNEELQIPAYDVVGIDTTGAGDAFVAGFLTGLVKGWDLKRIGYLANAVGALCITAMGATTGVRSFDETLRFMKETPTKD